MIIGRDLRESNTHVEATTAVHGLGAGVAVVGESTAQTLTNKTINAANNTITGITSAMIADGTIVNGDISSSAAIAYSKLALTGSITSSDIANDTIVNADINSAAAIDKTKISGTAVTLADSGIVTSAMIADGTIVDGDISTSAAIARTKVANPTADVSNGGFKLTNLGTPTTSTDASTKAYVDSQITALVGGAPGTLDTLNEIATAINNNGSFATSVVLRDGTQAMTGALAMGTNKITGLGTPTASTDAATKAYADSIVATAPSNLTGVITSVGAATSIGSQTGTGNTFVVSSSPTITSTNATSVSITAKGSASQTANLTEWRDSNNALLSSIASNGKFNGPVGATGTFTVSTIQDSALTGGTFRLSANTNNTINAVGARAVAAGGNGTAFVAQASNSTGGITGATANGTTITYTAGNSQYLIVGQLVTITGVVSTGNPSATAGAGFNLTNATIATAGVSTFTVTNSLTDTYTSGGAISMLSVADIQQWKNTAGTVLASVNSSGQFVGDGNLSVIEIPNAQTGTTYTTVLNDTKKMVTLSNASAITVTLPPSSSVAYPVGSKIDFIQKGAGQVTFAQGSGVTIRSVGATATAPKLRVQYSGATAWYEGSDVWYIVGDIA
jgi:hypothetical protein